MASAAPVVDRAVVKRHRQPTRGAVATEQHLRDGIASELRRKEGKEDGAAVLLRDSQVDRVPCYHDQHHWLVWSVCAAHGLDELDL